MLEWIKVNSGKIIYLAIVIVVAWGCARLLNRVIKRALDRSHVPDASIFINIARVLVWVIALTLVLQPVFGINPTTLFTALGIGGLAISLGLKDSVANTISGFQLMFSHVLQPGDLVTVSGITGEVTDVTWRQTVVRERNGNIMMIPNSVLNTTTLEKLDPANEAMVTIPFTAKPGVDTDVLTKELLATIDDDAKSLMDPKHPPVVRLTGFSPAGVTGNIVAYAKARNSLGALIDAVTRSVSGNALFTDLAASGNEPAKDLEAAKPASK
ncbi:MAG: mechanosensitive ion channel [Bifidobacterium sp.]|nr:mechanosensitive ion channel [Bifidobacterium sp.]